MFNKNAFADACAFTTGAVYIVAYLLSVSAPGFFKYWFNAQFFGADISGLLGAVSYGEAVGILITVFVTAWILGYFFAWCYNKATK